MTRWAGFTVMFGVTPASLKTGISVSSRNLSNCLRIPDGDHSPSAFARTRDVELTPLGKLASGHRLLDILIVGLLASALLFVHNNDCHQMASRALIFSYP
jgi:hypothetical protein